MMLPAFAQTKHRITNNSPGPAVYTYKCIVQCETMSKADNF